MLLDSVLSIVINDQEYILFEPYE